MVKTFFDVQPSLQEIKQRIEGFPSWLEIDLDCISFNLEGIRRRVSGSEVIPCVKGNAYGHGIVPIVAHLTRRGVKRVLVAKLWEAMQLRDAKLGCGIVSIDPVFTKAQFNKVVANDITQSVFNISTAKGMSEAALSLDNKTAGVFVKIDTGLGRVGVKYSEAADFIEAISSLPKIKVEGIFSTFAEDKELNSVQLNRMLSVIDELKRKGIDPGTKSMATSGSILHLPDSYLDAVRPGLTIYGVYPGKEGDEEAGLELRQALSFKARLEHVKWIEAGESLTYSRIFIAPKKMRVGTVHAGYSDGYPRGLTNKGMDRVGDTFRPVLGGVSVNHHIIDLTGTDIQVGDVVELIGSEGDNTFTKIAEKVGIQTYGICVGLNPLTPRVYYESGKPVAISEPKLVET